MTFQINGEPDRPKILLVHAMYTDSRCFEKLADELAGDFYVIRPTLNGHGTDHTVFHSIQEEADQILAFLQENGIRELELIVGLSLGGLIAFEVFRRRQIKIRHLFTDGAPFNLWPKYRRRAMEFILKGTAHSIQRNPQKKGIIDRKFPGAAGMMKEVCRRMTDESIRNLSEACYTYRLPEALDLHGETVTFLYGTAEKAAACIPALRNYQNARIILKEGYRHGQFLSESPNEYAELLRKIIHGDPVR